MMLIDIKKIKNNDVSGKMYESVHGLIRPRYDSVHGPAFPMLNHVPGSSRAYIS